MLSSWRWELGVVEKMPNLMATEVKPAVGGPRRTQRPWRDACPLLAEIGVVGLGEAGGGHQALFSD